MPSKAASSTVSPPPADPAKPAGKPRNHRGPSVGKSLDSVRSLDFARLNVKKLLEVQGSKPKKPNRSVRSLDFEQLHIKKSREDSSTRKPRSFFADGYRRIYDLIVESVMKNGYQPSHQELAAALGYRGRAGVCNVIKHAATQGFCEGLVDTSRSRAIKFLKTPDGEPFPGFILKPNESSDA